ncbi:MAG: glutaredoxin family protein [Bacillota bacterium]
MVMMYSLSTCPWCKKMKQFLREQGVAFEFLDVDLADEEEKTEAFAEMKRLGLDSAFPTVVVGDRAIQGYYPREVLQLVSEADE